VDTQFGGKLIGGAKKVSKVLGNPLVQRGAALAAIFAWVLGGLTVADPFFAVMAGGLVVAAGGALWVEMLLREIAVYVVVAMLPLVFAAMVWPARRVWATRTVEVLIALILAKVAIVVVLALGGAALDHAGVSGISKLLGGLALVILGAFSPWLLLRLIPMAEVASAAVGHIRGHVHATAGVRTPEAALAARAAARVGNDGHRHAQNGAPSAGTTSTPAAAPTAGPVATPPPTGNGHRPQSTPREDRPTQPSAHTVPGHGEQTQIMVQRENGGWDPHAETSTELSMPPADSEREDLPLVKGNDGGPAGAPAPVRDPHEPMLGEGDITDGGEQ